MQESKTTILSAEDEKYIEGYARGLFDIMDEHNRKIEGMGIGIKSYDPMSFWEGKMHSYVFNLKDGGRHHPVSDYKDKEEICSILLKEALEWLNR